MPERFLGIDTSNYRTSVIFFLCLRQLLPRL